MSDLTATSLVPSHAVDQEASRASRNRAALFFCSASLVLSLQVGQLTTFGRDTWQYLAYLALAIGVPMWSLPEITRALFERGKPLLLLCLVGSAWQFYVGDIRAVAQLGLLVFVTGWLLTERVQLGVRDVIRLYFILLLAGAAILCFTDWNPYSLLPGRAHPIYGTWRVSFFPNIAYSGILSLALLLILTSHPKLVRSYPIVCAVALYFLVFSFVRAAAVALLLYAALRVWFSRWSTPRPYWMFWIALLTGFGFVLLTVASASVIFEIQNFPGISALLLRGETGLSIDQISYQLYRPWLWSQQFKLFLSSPLLGGWGSSDFYNLVATSIENPETVLISGGSEALPTRLLFMFGLPGSLFTVFLVARLRSLALQDDRWACACFPALFSLMMSWGSVFHPSDGLFVILVLIMIRGTKGFIGDVSPLAQGSEMKSQLGDAEQ
ncbi:hypothetical protein [Bradyrhizobium guangdongense]